MRLSIVIAIACLLGVASASSLNKRSFLDSLRNKTADAIHGLEHLGHDANEKIHDLWSHWFGGDNNSTDNDTEDSTAATITKRAVNPLVLLNDLQDPAKFAQDLVKVLADMAVQGRKKRDLAEDLKKLADAGKQRVQDALKKIMDLFGSFKRPSSDETSTEKTVSKRDVSEDLQKLASAGKEKVAAALKQLQSLFEQVKGQFNHDASSKTVTKRDIAESLKKMGQAARENAQAAMQNIKDAFSSLFKGMKKPAPVEEVEEDSTEVSVAKRSLGEAFKGFGDAINNFYGMFRKPTKPVAPVAEDTTESS